VSLFSLFFQVGILWLLITLFTRSTSSSQSLRETWIVILGMMIFGFFSRWFLDDIFGPLTGLLNIAWLYFLIDKVCRQSRKVTLKICGWYLGILFFSQLILHLF